METLSSNEKNVRSGGGIGSVPRPSFPMEFTVDASATAGLQESWHSSSSDKIITCAVPSEFGGTAVGFSPEDLFGQAIVNCFLGSLKVYAQASQIRFSIASAKGTFTLDKNEAGQPVMQRCQLDVLVRGVERQDRMEAIARKALKSGFILNSVRTEIELSLRFE